MPFPYDPNSTEALTALAIVNASGGESGAITTADGITQLQPIGDDTELLLFGADDGVIILTPEVSGDSGSITIQTGVSDSGNSGSISLLVGSADGTRGDLNLSARQVNAPTGFSLYCANGNGIVLSASDTNADNGDGATVAINAGNGAGSGNGGNITMVAGTGVAQGNIILTGIPDTDPGVAGAIYSDTGTLKISAG